MRYAVGGTELLKDVDLSVAEAGITAVVGPSGAGKSTLLRAINRLIEPTGGEVYLDGEPTGAMDPLTLRRRVGMVFQLPALFGATVEEDVLYGARLAGRSADAGRLLEMVGLESSLAGRDPRTLSVGQQQRVSIARALAVAPETLLMDEPTSALDEGTRDMVEALILDLNRRLGITIVLVSHALDQVERVADRIAVLHDGRIAGEWSREDFFSASGATARELISRGI
ncbi:MAG: phosphate ABC transporter ATP-binding protein [Actinomycetota bacterium]|nr:phosphate ABC transporter ATP-binding protein [Actinomycetota bacterium]